jgi:hypothetical protein
MQCVANYEVQTDASVFEDGRWLTFEHPKGVFKVRLRNIVRQDYSTPFLLSLYLTFEAPDLDAAPDLADERLAECLNFLALATGCTYVRHRIRQIVDCTPGLKMRSCLMWGDSIEHENPHPIIDERITASLGRLLTYDPPPVLRRAMRWYRIGINAENPDDQFQYFWFALELIAIARKSTDKVNDKCPHCQSALYCEKCEIHPMHRPYEKQAIRTLMQSVDKTCDDAIADRLEKARNTLMHGGTLREIQEHLPKPHEEIVDVLGRIVFKVLINEFPRETFLEKLSIASPSTYIHRTLSGIAHVQTVVPIEADGALDLSFSGMQVSLMPEGPPQSARPGLIGMSLQQYERLKRLCYEPGDHQEMCRRICGHVDAQGEQVIAKALSTDMTRILEAVNRGERGPWQDLFSEIAGKPKPDALTNKDH